MDRRHPLIRFPLAVAAAMALTVPAPAQQGATPQAPANLVVRDHALDDGTRIDLIWDLSPSDVPLTEIQVAENDELALEDQLRPVVTHYEIRRAAEVDGAYRPVGRVTSDDWNHQLGSIPFVVEKCERNEPYWFHVVAVGRDGSESAVLASVEPMRATRQLFDGSPKIVGGRFWLSGRFWVAVITVILCGAVIYWINHVRKGRPLKVRKIAGLEAVDEAVGRATEMGRSVLFVPGIQDLNDIQTIAGITVLSRVAKTAAEYDAKIEVPTSRALVMTAAREAVQASFLSTGRPDAFNEDLIYYVTDEQFGYVAYLQGMMVREKPAACFYMGAFFAESLILAETGNSIGAIQVAGTAQPAQLPFFVAACDYTLIGEEFFAASAYLSGTPEELGSLKGQDVGKVVVAFGLVVGVTFATLASLSASETSTIALLSSLIKEIVMS